MAFADFETLKKQQELFRIVNVPELCGDVRLNRLDAAGVLEMVELQADIDKDEAGLFVDAAAGFDWAVEFCARTIANQGGGLEFNTPEGRAFLSLEFSAVKRCIAELTDLHGLDDSEEEKKTE